ncbi:hypothetical protein [Bradyrhizobium sp. BR 10289]|uniref:hypothetical protein n=1 Tax=Bradyrhizobium sp. BR 10289 TaxID=2749993 RepID=UPI00201C9BBF|nr:hypothetical protein [Bradyrhizobium sp. BR 10289]
MIDAVARLEPDGTTEEIERRLGVTSPEQHEPQEVETVRMIRLGREDLPIDRFGLWQAACAMVREGGLE